MSIRNCERCGTPIPSERSGSRVRFCSNRCRSQSYQKEVGILGLGLPKGATGAISELLVSADLLRRSYEVFRSVSAHCSCDLAILKEGKLLKVEVTTGYRNKRTGNLLCSKRRSEKFDILAVVVSGEIIYEPTLD